jgi:hypothetical protein
MKKFCLLLLVLFLSLSSASGADSVSTILQARITELLTITTTMTATTNVDVFNTSTTILGFVNFFSNRVGGWTITVSSSNNGSLRGVSTGNPDAYPYTLTFGNTRGIDLSNPYVMDMSGQTSGDGLSFQLTIDYQNFYDLATPVSPDTYRDTLTVTIAAA